LLFDLLFYLSESFGSFPLALSFIFRFDIIFQRIEIQEVPFLNVKLTLFIVYQHYLKFFSVQEGTMYVVWARGETELALEDHQFALPNVTAPHEAGVKMLQLLRADKILIPET